MQIDRTGRVATNRAGWPDNTTEQLLSLVLGLGLNTGNMRTTS